MSAAIQMTANDSTVPGSQPGPKPVRGAIVSTGWLGADSVYDHPDKRKIGRAMATSLALHGALLAGLIVAFAVVPTQVLTKTDPLEYNVVFLKDPGPGGGGGGNPTPAPPKKLEVTKHEAPAAVPIPVAVPVDPPPSLVAPIETTSATLMQAAGKNSVSLATWSGGGTGTGLGEGKGNGVGPGTGGGFGDGAYAPGNGVTWPVDILQVKPKYTPDAMRAKLQGAVELEIVVLPDGTVGDVRVVKSLDRASGLDDAAVEAAKKWRFKPGMKDGKPVATKVLMSLEFRLH
jgi:protein TonB